MMELKIRKLGNIIQAYNSFYIDDNDKKIRQKASPDYVFEMLKNLRDNNKLITNIHFRKGDLVFYISNYDIKVILKNKKDFKNDEKFSFIFKYINEKKYKLVKGKIAKVIIPIGLSITTILTGGINVSKESSKSNNPKPSTSYTDMDSITNITDNVIDNDLNIKEKSPMLTAIDDLNTQEINPILLNKNTDDKTENDNEEQEKEEINPDAAKYKNKEELGFVVTDDNKKYNINEDDKEFLMAIVAAECDKSLDDALGVITTILNRCESKAWINSHGTDPIAQATAPHQFVVYEQDYYKKYLGNIPENVRTAVNDALNGIRNHNFLSFRSNESRSFSDNTITKTSNRYK